MFMVYVSIPRSGWDLTVVVTCSFRCWKTEYFCGCRSLHRISTSGVDFMVMIDMVFSKNLKDFPNKSISMLR